MALDVNNLLQSVIPAGLSGLGAALSAIWAFFRDLKKQVEGLEKRLGSVDSKSGLAFAVSLTEENVRQLKNQVDSLLYPDRDRRSRTPTLTGMEEYQNPNIEQMIQASVQKILAPRIREFEERMERIENRFRKLVTEEDFEVSDRQRADEIATIRTTIAEVKGILQGLQSALGILKR